MTTDYTWSRRVTSDFNSVLLQNDDDDDDDDDDDGYDYHDNRYRNYDIKDDENAKEERIFLIRVS